MDRRRTLDEAFAAAAVAVAALRGERAGVPPDVEEVRRLFERLPDFERLVSLAAGEADRAAAAGGARVWQWFGFPGSAPRWDEAELSRARLLVACACAPLDGRGGSVARPEASPPGRGPLGRADRRRAAHGGRGVVAGRRSGSATSRCGNAARPAPAWRVRGLAVLVTSDERTRETLRARLERWLAAGAELERLPGELEASLVQSRTPPRVA